MSTFFFFPNKMLLFGMRLGKSRAFKKRQYIDRQYTDIPGVERWALILAFRSVFRPRDNCYAGKAQAQRTVQGLQLVSVCSHHGIQRPRTCKHFPEMPFRHIALAPPTFLGSTAASSLAVQPCVSQSSLKEFTLFQVWAVANIPIMSLGDLVTWLLLLWVWPRGVLGHRKNQCQSQRTQLTEVNLLPSHLPGPRPPLFQLGTTASAAALSQ